uniref:Phosphoribosylaminoimidazole-succinocarboxamide synthase n=1 Tax=Rhizophagus irregularis (strain DAOM 181602 / DAOM 197198 / MUCL 43194) TaxID=747089 RepID=U9U2M8_RHIID
MYCTILIRVHSCPDLELITCGKVRDLYRIDDNTLLFVATDRISAFDVIMKNGVPGKEKLLTQISVFWFNYLKDILPNHIITTEFDQMSEKKAIVRGYITGSAWSEYKKKGTVCDTTLPEGLKEGQSFEKALYTPNADQISEISVKLYTKAKKYALSKGIIIADTEFEFGRDDTGILYIVDEVLTPDSSRFWLSLNYEVGKSQESFDKQYLRNYLLSIDFDKKTSIELPNDIVTKTMERYIEAYKMITDSDPTFL